MIKRLTRTIPPKSGPTPQGLNIQNNTVKTVRLEKLNGRRQLAKHTQHVVCWVCLGDDASGNEILVKDLFDDFGSFLEMFKMQYHAEGGIVKDKGLANILAV